MENKPEIEPSSSTLYPSIVLLSMIFIFQFYSKSKEVSTSFNPEQKKKGDKLFWLYLIALQIGKASQWSISPYSFDFFETYHNMKEETIAKFICVSLLSSTFFGTFVVGYLNDQIHKRNPCILFGITMSISTMTRLVHNDYVLVISQVFFGIASSILFSSFENWFISQCNRHLTDKNTHDAILTNAFEKNALSDSIVAMCLNMLVSQLKEKYGFHMPFVISFIMCITVILFVLILYDDAQSDWDTNTIEIKPKDSISMRSMITNSLNTMKEIKRKPILLYIGLTESLVFSCLQVFILIWTPTLKDLNPNTDIGQTFTMFMMAFMAGGTSFRVLYSYYNSDTMTIAKVVGLLGSVGYLMILLRKDYNNVFNGCLCFQASIGLFYPVYSKLKQEYLPKGYRGTLMIMFKVPFNLIIAYLFLTLNKTVNKRQMVIGAFIAEAVVLVIQLVFFSSMKNRKSNKDEEGKDNKEKNKGIEDSKKKNKKKTKQKTQ